MGQYNDIYKENNPEDALEFTYFIFDLFYGILKTYKFCNTCQRSNSVKQILLMYLKCLYIVKKRKL